MNHWPFIVAAYAVTAIATAALVAWALLSMRAAEAKLEKYRDR